jgi:glycosyltransferase involved in cell wall biosynthesis
MRILALEPYFGGSHRAFLEGWMARSRHEWTLLSLPATKWKWRMRHAAVTFARQTAECPAGVAGWDLVFCSDMLNLAEFLGLVREPVSVLPRLCYFHENQLTYPVQHVREYDYHFAFSNMMTALAATRVWFNSAFHRESFLSELRRFLGRMPDHQPLEAVEAIRRRSCVRPPGIDAVPPRGPRPPGPLRILWAARWEYDKQPELFFRALGLAADRGLRFELSVIGGREGRVHPAPAANADLRAVLEAARQRFADRIAHWGYVPGRDAYLRVLGRADVVVSTAAHEFFGIGIVEAVASGAFPLVPRRLAYPEVLAGTDDPDRASFFYDGDARDLAGKLVEAGQRLAAGDLWQGRSDRGVRAVSRFLWENRIPAWDRELETLRGSPRSAPGPAGGA